MKVLTLEIANLQKSISEIGEGVNTGPINQLQINADTIDKTWKDILSKIPWRQRFKNPVKPQTRPQITNVSNICFEHQKWGYKADISNCNPHCVYEKSLFCVSHRIYGYAALHCKLPCQFIKLTR